MPKRTKPKKPTKRTTWKALVRDVMARKRKRRAGHPLSVIYAAIEKHPKACANQHWKAKVRQTLQLGDEFERVGKGVWKLKS